MPPARQLCDLQAGPRFHQPLLNLADFSLAERRRSAAFSRASSGHSRIYLRAVRLAKAPVASGSATWPEPGLSLSPSSTELSGLARR
eukprot:6585779-Prymnesium_polylepis.1